jgi:hypothetical protein
MASTFSIRGAQLKYQLSAHLSATNKTIAASEIFKRFIEVAQLQPDVDLTKPIATILHGNLNPYDLALACMDYDSFKSDGLTLQKKDVLKAKTIGAFGDLIYQWYVDNGWTITGLDNA